VIEKPSATALDEESEQEKAALAKQIGQRLKNVRLLVGKELHDSRFSREKFAEHLGVPAPTIKNYESGRMPPSVHFLYQLYLHTGFTPSWICLGLEPSRDPDPKPILETSVLAYQPRPLVRLTRFRASEPLAPSASIRKEAARVAAQILLEYADS
jgi:transcriptional regulator with XRE-family HTH domain